MKVILDTNVWVSGIFWLGGIPFQILGFFDKHRFKLVISQKTFEEIVTRTERIRKRYQFGLARKEEYLDFIRQHALFVKPTTLPSICRDPDDNHLLAAAEASKANYLVTGDKDLLVLRKHKRTRIISPKDFLAILKKKT